jgi:hypothetical protein
MEGGEVNGFTQKIIKKMTYNLVHFARILREHPIPTIGNT